MNADSPVQPAPDTVEAEIIRLAPWHLDVELKTGVTTSLAPRGETVSFADPKRWFVREVTSVYRNGLDGKRFLDCACNCGGYSFWAKSA